MNHISPLFTCIEVSNFYFEVLLLKWNDENAFNAKKFESLKKNSATSALRASDDTERVGIQ